MHFPRPLPLLLVLLTPLASLAAQEFRPTSLPVHVTAEVDASTLPTAGRATLHLHFVAEATPDRAIAVRVELRRRGRMFVRRDHAPPVPSTKWAVGKSIDYDLPVAFPIAPDVDAGETVEVLIAFLDPPENKVVAPLSREVGGDGLAKVADFVFPDLSGTPDAAAIDAVIAQALELAPKQPEVAWQQLEFTFRRIDDYAQKRKLQKALLTVGRTPPPPQSFEEQDIVRGRINDERARYLRQIAGRMYDQGKLLGALKLLDGVGGALQEQADRAVLGALADAKRVTQDRDGIAAKVFAVSKEQQAAVDALVAKYPGGKERLDAGLKMAKNAADRAVARELVRTLEFTPELREQAAAAREKIEQAWLADVPADQAAEADKALQHPCWARTTTRQSHRFILIGPKTLLDGVSADSLLRFDLAYVYLTDLFGRVPNPDGDRVTVYFKELWEFGGGVGGGKIIDVGNANADEKAARVDNGLFYHELTHCIDDTNPVYGGFHEGLADFGAAFAEMELGQIAAARGAIGLATRAFLQDYLDRDLEYWRIPNYGPSAGFFLHFMTEYGKEGDVWHWERYRKFFRDYRDSKVKDARTPDVARAFAYHLVQAFGEKAFADLIRFRWPLVPSDLDAIAREQQSAQRPHAASGLDEAPGSPVPRDQMAQRLQREGAGIADYALELGVVKDWWVIGPFRKEGTDADAYRFPPELEVDLGARYPSINNNPTWREPGEKPVTVDRTGWLQFDFSYMDWTATYALTHVYIKSETEAWLHLRADDEVTVFVNDELVGKYDGGGGPLGPWRPRWDVMLPDAIRFPVTLRAGRNKILLKVYNHTGPSGVTLAIAQRNGLPLTGWIADRDPPAKKLSALDVPDAKRWPSRLKLNFAGGGSHRKLETPVGQWRVRNGALEGFATDRGVEWRKYTVRPGFPKDSPSNLAWLPEKATELMDAFALTMELPAGSAAPKLCVIVQGDGMRDALSGWTLILEPSGDNVRAYLERYDQRIYDSGAVPWHGDAKKPSTLELVYWGRRLTVKLGGEVMFDQAPLLPIPGKSRIGLATWGEALRIESLELRAPARTR